VLAIPNYWQMVDLPVQTLEAFLICGGSCRGLGGKRKLPTKHFYYRAHEADLDSKKDETVWDLIYKCVDCGGERVWGNRVQRILTSK
jgi:hypothetical protein